MRTVILTFLCLFFISSVYAITDYQKEGTTFERITYCTNDGAVCTNGSCNITIIAPSSDVIVSNQAMSNISNIYNYTLQPNLTKGIYHEIITCCDYSVCNTNEGYFQVTTNGKEENDLYGIIALCFIVGLLFFFAFKITDTTHFFLQLILIFFALCFAILIPAQFYIISYQSIFFKLFLAFTVVFFIYVLVYYIWYNYKKFLSRTP